MVGGKGEVGEVEPVQLLEMGPVLRHPESLHIAVYRVCCSHGRRSGGGLRFKVFL